MNGTLLEAHFYKITDFLKEIGLRITSLIKAANQLIILIISTIIIVPCAQ